MPGISPIDMNPRIKGRTIKALAEGKGLKAASDELGVATSTMWRWSNREDIKKAVEEQAARILELTPKAVDNYKRILDAAAEAEVVPHLIEYEIDDPDNPGTKKKVAIPADAKQIANNLKLLSTAQIVSKDVLATAGILASHTESRTIVAILSGDAAEALTPALAQLMGAIVNKPEEQEAIDITPE